MTFNDNLAHLTTSDPHPKCPEILVLESVTPPFEMETFNTNHFGWVYPPLSTHQKIRKWERVSKYV